MHKRILVGLLLAALGSFVCGNVALAEGKPGDEPPPADAPLNGDRLDVPPHGHGPGFGLPQEVIQTASEIERLYREQGKPKEAIALYRELLAKTRDPLVRHFAYDSIARIELQPADADKAVATLKQSLDESLQHLNQLPAPAGGPGRDGQLP
jgi:tetratricopeptide (TPR) repeat protein